MNTKKFRNILVCQLIMVGVFWGIVLIVANNQVRASELNCGDDQLIMNKAEGNFSLLCDNDLPTIEQSRISESSANLLANSSFENGTYAPENIPTHWSQGMHDPSATFTWVDDQAYSGDRSVRIVADSLNDAYWLQTVSVQPYTGYKLSGWIKTEDVVHGHESVVAGANLSIYGAWLLSTGLFNTNDWTYVSLVFNSEEATEITIAARLGFWAGRATGTAWFDDLRLEKIIYKVAPILFVPNDLTPYPWALDHVNKQMQMVQRWSAEQLRGQTFTLEPAQLVIGSYPLAHYYVDCYPPISGCDHRYKLTSAIDNDLATQGFPSRQDRLWGVFFQGDNLTGTNIGGGLRFVRAITPKSMFADCSSPGCVFNLASGATAHEFGHAIAFGYHTYPDPEGSPQKSIMGNAFRTFPHATFGMCQGF